MLNTIYRTLFFYFFITFAYRIMGKREVGQLGIIDLIVSILIAELVAISIENTKDSVFITIMPIVILVLLEVLLGYISVKSRIINRIFGGKPTTIIKKGKIDYKNLISQRYSIDDLLLELRLQGIDTIEDVEYAILETNGKLSIFKKNQYKNRVPLPLIIEGKIEYNTLRLIHKNKDWLTNTLNYNNLELKEIFYAIYKDKKLYVIKKEY